ncbi:MULTISPECIES: CARDB domain-containing protein [Haloarcula]|uniref:CARDB domain-containing protein n=1 Tax=Haloarcula TaxID=2237 RepID=UPI0023E7D5DE|nr:CARDB domain-containing protein [Halomicroarcula sp. SHR3]
MSEITTLLDEFVSAVEDDDVEAASTAVSDITSTYEDSALSERAAAARHRTKRQTEPVAKRTRTEWIEQDVRDRRDKLQAFQDPHAGISVARSAFLGQAEIYTETDGAVGRESAKTIAEDLRELESEAQTAREEADSAATDVAVPPTVRVMTPETGELSVGETTVAVPVTNAGDQSASPSLTASVESSGLSVSAPEAVGPLSTEETTTISLSATAESAGSYTARFEFDYEDDRVTTDAIVLTVVGEASGERAQQTERATGTQATENGGSDDLPTTEVLVGTGVATAAGLAAYLKKSGDED